MLNNIKTLLGFDSNADNAELDKKLNVIISITQSRLKILLGGVEEVPASMEYIIVEVSIIRYNKIGSEGLDNHTVEGESLTFTDDDFAAYAREIQAFLESQKESARGKLRFL